MKGVYVDSGNPISKRDTNVDDLGFFEGERLLVGVPSTKRISKYHVLGTFAEFQRRHLKAYHDQQKKRQFITDVVQKVVDDESFQLFKEHHYDPAMRITIENALHLGSFNLNGVSIASLTPIPNNTRFLLLRKGLTIVRGEENILDYISVQKELRVCGESVEKILAAYRANETSHV